MGGQCRALAQVFLRAAAEWLSHLLSAQEVTSRRVIDRE